MIVFTEEFFNKISTRINENYLDGMINDWPTVLEKYSINTENIVCMFLGQGATETDGFHTFVEYGNKEYFSKYDNREDLGNNGPPDGFNYRGRGVFQLTGRSNYEEYGNLMGIDLINNPDLASEPKYAVEIACLYWSKHNLSIYAEKRDIISLTRKINGGLNSLDTRRLYTQRAFDNWQLVLDASQVASNDDPDDNGGSINTDA